jgi:hypothetical protein
MDISGCGRFEKCKKCTCSKPTDRKNDMKTYPNIRKTPNGFIVIETREGVYRFNPEDVLSVKAQPESPNFADMLFLDIVIKGEALQWSLNVGSQNSLEYKEMIENSIREGEVQ